jgi:hypothetical protein
MSVNRAAVARRGNIRVRVDIAPVDAARGRVV